MEQVLAIAFYVVFLAIAAAIIAAINIACTRDFVFNKVPPVYCPGDSSVAFIAEHMLEEGIRQREIVEFVQQCKTVELKSAEYTNMLRVISDNEREATGAFGENLFFMVFAVACLHFAIENLVLKIVVPIGFVALYLLFRFVCKNFIQSKIMFPGYREEETNLEKSFPSRPDDNWKNIQQYYDSVPFLTMEWQIMAYQEQEEYIRGAKIARAFVWGILLCLWAQLS